MFFVEKPYVSDFFKKSLVEHKIPVVNTDMAKKMGLYPGTNLVNEGQAVEMIRNCQNPTLYATSENAIGWMAKHLAFTDLPKKIGVFKDKLKFRELTASIFPDFYFKGVGAGDLNKIDFNQLPLPFIIKPSIGFFSMGVHKVSNQEEWLSTIHDIHAEIEAVRDLYPNEVFDSSSFIIEQCITGDEFAVDAYFDATGQPVVLGIMSHVFSSDTDVSDRVYLTSRDIIEENLKEFTEFAGKIGHAARAKNFPVHMELRRNKNGTLLPIEVNPMRFGGWCTTADLTFMAYGFNPYLYYYSQKKPDWPVLLKGKKDKFFSIIVLENSTGKRAEEIAAFDYDLLLSKFEKPMELRKIDFREYPVFGFLFTETRKDNFIELKNILDSDLKEFIS